MSTTAAQKSFNPFIDFNKRYRPDVWHGLPKHEKRENLKALLYSFLIEGGEIVKIPTKKARGAGRPSIFGKDVRSAAYDRDNVRFLSGHDFTQRGPRWTAKAVSDSSASKRDAERKAGTSHRGFSGAVIEIGGKLQPRTSTALIDPVSVDLVSDAMAASAKRDGKRGDRQVATLIDDTADTLSDAAERATVTDDLNLMAIDHEHNDRFKLAA